MIRSLKLFAACVDSMRMAEKEFQVHPTPTNKKIMEDLQSKVDAWVTWIHNQEDAELAKSVPPFINKPRSSYKSPNHNITQQLLTNHTPEEIECFFQSMQGL